MPFSLTHSFIYGQGFFLIFAFVGHNGSVKEASELILRNENITRTEMNYVML